MKSAVPEPVFSSTMASKLGELWQIHPKFSIPWSLSNQILLTLTGSCRILSQTPPLVHVQDDGCHASSIIQSPVSKNTTDLLRSYWRQTGLRWTSCSKKNKLRGCEHQPSLTFVVESMPPSRDVTQIYPGNDINNQQEYLNKCLLGTR